MNVTTSIAADLKTPHYIDIPIHNKQGMFIVSSQINGKNATLYLDTGSSSSVIDQQHLADFNIKRNDAHTQGNGIAVGTDQIAYTPITINQLVLGKLVFSKVPAVAMNLDDINQGNPNPLSGILGQDFLLSNKALISFSDTSLLLPNDNGKPRTLMPQQAINLKRLSNGFFIVPVTINAIKTQLLLDSGSPDIVLDSAFNTQLFGEKTTETAIKVPPAKGTQALANQTPAERLNVQSVQIGHHRLERSTLLSTDLSHITQWLESQENISVNGTLGLKALQELGAVLDLSKAILYIR